MAIVKNNFRVSRPDGDLWMPGSRGSASDEEEDDDDGLRTTSSSDSQDGGGRSSDSDSAASDSGMGSDELGLSEMGDVGTEFCQVGNQSCSLPLELYDLPDLGAVLSAETWNDCLSEEERFSLAEHLPDMDQETFTRTLSELLSGANFHFGSPLASLFSQMKGGLCDPRVVLYRRGMNFLQRRQHYHQLRKYQNSMVGSIVQIRNACQNYEGHGIEERLRLLNILRSQRSLGYERDGDVEFETDSESGSALLPVKVGQVSYRKERTKGLLVGPQKASTKNGYRGTGQYPVPVKYAQHPRQNQIVGFDSGTIRHVQSRMRVDDGDYEDEDYEMSNLGDWNASQRRAVARDVLQKQGKKHEMLRRYEKDVTVRYGEEDPQGYARLSHYHGKTRNADEGVTVASFDYHSPEKAPKKTKHFKKELAYSAKDLMQHPARNGAQADWSADHHPVQLGEFETSKGKSGPDSKARSYKNFPAQVGSSYLHSVPRGNEKIGRKSAQSKGIGMEHLRHSPMFDESEDTESSSDQDEGDGDMNFGRTLGYPSDAVEGRQLVVVKTNASNKGNKLAKMDKKPYSHLVDGGASIHSAAVEAYSTKVRQKGKIYEPGYSHDIKSTKKGHLPHPREKLQPSSLKSYATERKRKEMTDLDHSLPQSNYMHDYDSGILNEVDEDLDWNSKSADSHMQSKRSGNRSQASDSHAIVHEMPNRPLLGCSTMTKKRKGKLEGIYLDELDESFHQLSSPAKQSDDPDPSKKKGKKKGDAGTVVTPEPVGPEKGTVDSELEAKAQKKPFTLITPSIHTGFSFSIIHLLSAVRKAMVNPHVEDTMGIDSHLKKDDGRPKPRREEQGKMLPAGSVTHPFHFRENMDVNSSENAGQNNLPSLTVQEIVNRVRSNPGDPCILETQEPLQDLVRGVLRIFASKTAPLGAKGWKPLVFYEKPNKSWTWDGPVSASSSDYDNDTAEEETSSEAWGIPHKMLVKLVDAFANWLKSGQETLQQIGSLPAPPIMALANIDEKERFKDLRAQKSLNTFSPTTDEMRAYFRTEEHLRYSVPDRAFSYTAYDGKKSIVAPLRRGGGKPTSKARDHFMLKPDRPPHVTILCLVRDAAARLPGSIGTRADVCTLIRDSQYIVEEVSDAQVNQVVSGALDRLHYERDPCVQFDGERKLWVYLHRDREEEDFEDDGTSSTKKWKRQKKDPTDNSDTGAVNDVSYHATGDPATDGSFVGYDLNPDLNVDSSVHAGEQSELIYNGLRSNMDNIQSYIDSTQGDRRQGNPMSWDVLGLNPLRENKMLCQENSTNEDFDDDTFSRERPVGRLTASLL